MVAATALAVAASAPATAADPPPAVLLGEFDSDVPETVLDCPDPSSPFRTSVTGAGILGGDLELALDCAGGAPAVGPTAMSLSAAGLRAETTGTAPATVRMVWDGSGGTPDLDPRGLDGLDLTAGGTKDSFVIDFTEVGAPVGGPIPVGAVMELWIYTDADNFAHNFVAVGEDGVVRVPLTYVNTGPQTGTGADVTDVGAIAATFADLPPAGGSTVGSLETGSVVAPTMTDSLVTDLGIAGQPDPGDTIEYTVTVANPASLGAIPVTDASFEWTPEADGGTLVAGSVTTSQGTVAPGGGPTDPAVAVDLGTVAAGGTATITFRVVIGHYGTLSNQGRLTYTVAPIPADPESNTLTTITQTDDPDTEDFSDATITAVVAPPVVANDDTASVYFNIPATGNVLTNDTGPAGGLVASLWIAPVHGTVVLNADGSYTYTPNADYSGPDQLTYRTTSVATNEFDEAVLDIVVGEPVVANDDDYTTALDTVLTGNVLANDTGPGAPLAASLVTAPGHGTIVLNADGSFSYTPDAGYSGPDTFTYLAATTTLPLLTDEGDVTITVQPAPDPVVAGADTFETAFQTPVSGNVLANDTGGAGPLSAEVVDEPEHGTLTLEADGAFTYTPAAGFSGTDAFTYRAVDAVTGATGPTGPSGPVVLALPADVGTVTITVAAAPATTVPPTTAPGTTAPPTTGTLPPPPTTDPLAPPTVPGSLPATGSDSSGLAVTALLLLGLGAALTLTVRARRHG